MSDMVKATAYLVVKGKRRRYRPLTVDSASITRVTQNKPATLTGDEIAVKVTIELPAAAFEALQPEAVITVAENLIQFPVEVEAIEP